MSTPGGRAGRPALAQGRAFARQTLRPLWRYERRQGGPSWSPGGAYRLHKHCI